ncbi:MAG: flagellar export protein FliJ [Desulfobulbus sp.]|jgi:flagellar export protein FliJ|nr:flagellar export protein FliJ [Desulfobulbus sp.]
MKPFALGTVLKYRKQLEDAAHQELRRALQAEARLLETLQRVQTDLSDLYAGLNRDHVQGTTADQLLLYEHCLALVREQEQRRLKDVARQRQQVEQKRQLLVKTSTDRKILEKLSEQQNSAYRQYLDRKETKMLDEIATLSRERREGGQ